MRKMDKIMEMYGLHSADLAAEPLKMNDPEVLKQKIYAYMGDVKKIYLPENLPDDWSRLRKDIEGGTKFISVFFDHGKDAYKISREPKEGYTPALIPADSIPDEE